LHGNTANTRLPPFTIHTASSPSAVMTSAASDPTDAFLTLVCVAAAAAAAGESSGGHTTTSNKRPRQRECENARRGQVKGAPAQSNRGPSHDHGLNSGSGDRSPHRPPRPPAQHRSASSSSSSVKAQPPCTGKNCSETIKPKQGKYCKGCKSTNNFHCSHWLCVTNGLQDGHDILPKYGDPCPNNGVTCATANCRRKIAASAASRGTHTICDSCRPRGASRGMKTKRGKRKNESLSDSTYGLPFAPSTTPTTTCPPPPPPCATFVRSLCARTRAILFVPRSHVWAQNTKL